MPFTSEVCKICSLFWILLGSSEAFPNNFCYLISETCSLSLTELLVVLQPSIRGENYFSQFDRWKDTALYGWSGASAHQKSICTILLYSMLGMKTDLLIPSFCIASSIIEFQSHVIIDIRFSNRGCFGIAGTSHWGCDWSSWWNCPCVMGTATSFGDSSDYCVERQARQLAAEGAYNIVSCWSRNTRPHSCLEFR